MNISRQGERGKVCNYSEFVVLVLAGVGALF